jgi:hypothetical protein
MSVEGCRAAVLTGLAWSVLLAAVPLGCGQKPNDAGAGAGTGAGSGGKARAAAPPGPPLSDKECRKFTDLVERAVATGNIATLNSAIDWDTLIDTATAGIEASPQVRKGFTSGLKSALTQERSLVGQIIARTKEGGAYSLLRIHDQDGQRRALFRMIMPANSGVNYHDFVLARSPSGVVRAVDLYVFLSGEMISQTFRRMYIPTAAHESRGILSRLTGLSGPEKEFVENFPKFEQMANALREQKFQSVIDTYNQLPAGLKKDKTFLLLRFQAAQGLDEKTYASAIEDFRTYHPSDPCVDMLSIDYFLLKKQYPRALECINRLDKAVGGDPYINVLRAGLHLEQGDLDAAERDARKAIEQEPTLSGGYMTMVTVSAGKKHYDETLAMLKTLHEKFHVRFDDLAQSEALADFVKSPQYQEWLAYERKSRSSEADHPEPKTPAPPQK